MKNNVFKSNNLEEYFSKIELIGKIFIFLKEKIISFN